MLKEGKVAIGTGGSADSSITHYLANVGFDYLFFDTQHSPQDAMELQPVMQAMKGRFAIPVVRVATNDVGLICKLLDIGAKGIIIPMINTKEDTINAVRSCKYPPEGVRSSVGRAREFWGTFKSHREYMSIVNEGVLILPQIETEEAVNNIDEILSVPGVDVAMVGPLDLSVSMGISEDYSNPRFQKALDTVVAACRKTGVAAGLMFIPNGGDINKFIERGFKFISQSWLQFAFPAIKNALAKIKR